jgi:hypothetical protein
MKTRLINQSARLSSPCITRAKWMALSLLTLFAASSSLTAQTVVIRPAPLRLTVPKGVAYSNAIIVTNITSGLTTPLVNLSVSGIPSSGNANAWLSQTAITSNATVAVTLSYTNDATILGGTYELVVTASGDANYRLPIPLRVAYVWSGVNFTNAVSTNFASAGNWRGGVAPGPTDDVVFNDGGGQAAAPGPTNVVITADTEVSTVRFANEGSATRAHNTEIQNGATFKGSGSGLSLSMLRDTKNVAGPTPILATISGNGTLKVTNANATIASLIDNQAAATLDLRNLNNFEADVVRLGIGDYRVFPNYYTNGYTSATGSGGANTPTRFIPLVWLAKTNIIKCSLVDANNYNNPGVRDYALMIANDEASGSTTSVRFTMGISNAFFLDSICWTGSGSGGGANNYNFISAGSYAQFRGIGGGRMSVWAQGDASGVPLSGSNVRGTTVDFSNGQVDAQVDRLYLTRSRTNSSGFTVQGTLTIGGASLGSIFDVNTAFLGNQDVLNLNTGAVASVVNSPIGTLNVNSNAIFRANENLYLSYTTAAATGTPNYPENTTGIININNGGTLMASNIVAGGTKMATRREIVMTAGGNLIVTNGIGENASNGEVSILNMTASALTLHVNGTASRVYAKTVTLNGLANVINIASIANVGGSYPVRIPLVSYETLSGSFGLGTLPTQSPTLYGWLDVDTSNQTVDLIITTNAPNRLVWKGNISSSWNHTDPNWVTSPGGIQTNFNDGNLVQFDDSATGSTDISVDETVLLAQLPGTSGMLVTNVTKNYRFAGFNSIGGSAQMVKQGTGNLTFDGNSALATLVTGGTLLGSGTIGSSVAMQNGTSFNFAGTINGGLSVSNATAIVNGIVNGGLNLLAGSLTNNGTIAGSIVVATNATLNNTLGATINVIVPWTISTNATLINNGTINQAGSVGGNNGLTVNGTLKGVGTIVIPSGASPDARVTIGAGGTLMIGNSPNEITNITIATRLDFLSTSTTTFDVDNASAANDKIFLTAGFITGKVNFGNANNLGGRFVLNKLAGPDFNLATSLHLFDLFGPGANVPDNANQALPGVVPAPAPGLAWDVSQMVTNLILNVNAPTLMTNSITVNTNGVKSFVFEWPENYRGWRLEHQTNSLAVGLESPSTNWVSIANSFAGTNTQGNSLYYPDITNNPSAFWFRASVTFTDTNGIGLVPVDFFRLTYP